MARSNRKTSDEEPEIEDAEQLEEGEILEHEGDGAGNEDLEDIEKGANDGGGDVVDNQPTGKKKGKGKGKQVEKKSGASPGKEAADKAIFTGEFVWEVKPDPYEGTLRRQNENQDVCERRIFKDIRKAYAQSTEKSREEQGEVEITEFQWQGYEVHWEKFLRIDWDAERRFENSQISTRLKSKKEARVKELQEANGRSKDKAIQEPPLKARQMLLAEHYFSLDGDKDKNGFGKAYPKNDKGKKKSANLLEPKAQLDIVDGKLICVGEDADQKQWWSGLERTFDQYMGTDPKKYPQDDKNQAAHTTKGILIKIVSAWKGWKADIKANRVYQNKFNQIVSDEVDELSLLRRIPEDKVTVLVDKKDKLIAFLVPEAIQDAFKRQPWVKDRMEIDTMHFYKHIKKPKPQTDKRHVSGKKKSETKSGAEAPDRETSDASAQSPKQHNYVGTDHYGQWHAIDGGEQPIVETSDSLQNTAGARQVLLHYLENTGGAMTKLLNFWFGVWDSKLREEYREVYRQSPKFARLPPTNEDRPETYSLRIYDINSDTNVHKDTNDWVGGLTGLVHLGEFEGGQMCLPELGLRLDGYQSGAMLLYRGGLEHYVTPWNSTEGYRYAFEHTTHERTRQVVIDKEPYPPYEAPDFPEGEEPVGTAKLEVEETGTTPTKESKSRGKGAKGKGKAAISKTQKSKTKDDGGSEEQNAEEEEKTQLPASTSAAAGKVKATSSKAKAPKSTTKASTSKPGRRASPRSSSSSDPLPLRRSPRTATPSPRGITKPQGKPANRTTPKSPSLSGSPPPRRSPRITTPSPRGIAQPTKAATNKVKDTTSKSKAAAPRTEQPEKTPPPRRSSRATTPSPRGIVKPTKKPTSPKSSKSLSSSKKSTSKRATRSSSRAKTPSNSSGGPSGKRATRSSSRAKTPSSSSGGPSGKPTTRSSSRAKTPSSSSDTPLMTKSQKKRRAEEIEGNSGDDGEPTSSPKRGKRPKLNEVINDETENDQGDDGIESANDDGADGSAEGDGDKQGGEEDEDDQGSMDENDDQENPENENDPRSSTEESQGDGAESDQDQESGRSDPSDGADENGEGANDEEDKEIVKSQDNSESARSSDSNIVRRIWSSTRESTYWFWAKDRDGSTGTPGGHPTQPSNAPTSQDNTIDVDDADDNLARSANIQRGHRKSIKRPPGQVDNNADGGRPLPPRARKHPQTAGKKPPEHVPDASDESHPNEEDPVEEEIESEPENDEDEDNDRPPTPRGKHPQTAGKKLPEHIPDASDESQPNEEEFENDPDDGSSDSQSQKHHPPEEEEAVADEQEPDDEPEDESESEEE